MPQNIQDKPQVTTVNLDDQVSLIRAGDSALVNGTIFRLAAALGLINVQPFSITGFSLGSSLFEIGAVQNRTATVTTNIFLDGVSPVDVIQFTPTTATPFTTTATQSVTPNGTATHSLAGYSFGAASAGLDSGKAVSFSGGRLIYDFGVSATNSKVKNVALTSYSIGTATATQQIIGLYPIFHGSASASAFAPSTVVSRATVVASLTPSLRNVVGNSVASGLNITYNNNRGYILVDDAYPTVSKIQIFLLGDWFDSTAFDLLGTFEVTMLDGVNRVYRLYRTNLDTVSGTFQYRLVFV